MRANVEFINIKMDMSDEEIMNILRHNMNSPIYGNKEDMDRINKLKNKILVCNETN